MMVGRDCYLVEEVEVARDWYLMKEVEVGRADEERGEVLYVFLFWYHNPVLVNMMVGRD